MKKICLTLSMLLVTLALLTVPAMAIGPQNAVNTNNENMVFTSYSVQIFLPCGSVNEWIIEDPSHVQIKSAVDFSIRNAYEPSTASEIIYNKWNLLSEDVFEEFLINAGFDPGTAYYISHVIRVGGVYYKEVFTGN